MITRLVLHGAIVSRVLEFVGKAGGSIHLRIERHCGV